MIPCCCLGSMSESTVLALGLLGDKGKAESDAGILTTICSCSARLAWGSRCWRSGGSPAPGSPDGLSL
jgi:hypothetical protein